LNKIIVATVLNVKRWLQITGLAAYTYLPKKPSIDIYPKDLPALLGVIFYFRRTHVSLKLSMEQLARFFPRNSDVGMQ
jgi:hypothetical protein